MEAFFALSNNLRIQSDIRQADFASELTKIIGGASKIQSRGKRDCFFHGTRTAWVSVYT